MKTANTLIDISTDRAVCTGAGALLLADTADTLGATDVLDEHLTGFTLATVTHSPGTVLSSVAVVLTAGATCLDDLDLLTPLVDWAGHPDPIDGDRTPQDPPTRRLC